MSSGCLVMAFGRIRRLMTSWSSWKKQAFEDSEAFGRAYDKETVWRIVWKLQGALASLEPQTPRKTMGAAVQLGAGTVQCHNY